MSIERYDPAIHPLNATAIDHWNRYLFARQHLNGRSVLDIGCGTGYGTELLAEAPEVETVAGVDRSYEALFHALSRRRSPKTTYLHANDATFTPLAGHWQTIVAFEIWEHLRCPRTAALCSRLALGGGGRLIASLPLDEQPGQNEHHLHCYTAESARSLVSEFFSISHEYHQPDNITFVGSPVCRQQPSSAPITVLALLQVYGGTNGAFLSAMQEIASLREAGMRVIVLCDDPPQVMGKEGIDAFYLPLSSSFRGEGEVSPVHLSMGCGVAQWFDVDAIYASHEFMPLARAVAEVAQIPTAMHLRGLPSAGWYEGPVRPARALPRHRSCRLVANSETTAAEYARALRIAAGDIPISAPRIDFETLDAQAQEGGSTELAALAERGPMVIFIASRRNIVKGFGEFLECIEAIEKRHPGRLTYCVAADPGDWNDEAVVERLHAVGVERDRYHLTSAVQQVGSYFRAAAVCVIPSQRNESFCRVAAEAIGMGVSVAGFSGGHLDYFRRYGARLKARGDVTGLAQAVISAVDSPAPIDARALRAMYGAHNSSVVPDIVRESIMSEPPRALVVAMASDGLSAMDMAAWVERLSMLASQGMRVCLILSTSRDEVERGFLEAAHRARRTDFIIDVVRRSAGDRFVFGRAINEAAARGLELMPEANGVLCANDDTWPSHLALAAMRGWLDLDGLTGAISSSGAGGLQDHPEFFREMLAWRDRWIEAPHRLSAFWLYVSRECWQSLGGFDESFSGYGCEDSDLCLRASRAGYAIRLDRTCYVDHLVAGSFMLDEKLEQSRATAIERFLNKHNMSADSYQVPLPLRAEKVR
ncbi:MAG: glycosyltransferase [Sphingomonadales bacterium]|nr:glycosyltransferase [Sphingomonadales bacterium]